MATHAASLRVDGLSVQLFGQDGDFRLEIDSLALAAGAMIALTGESGAGKTLLLELMGLLRRPAPGGRYIWTASDGTSRDLDALWNEKRRRGQGIAEVRGRAFGFVPQIGGLLPYLSVEANAALPQKITGRHDPALVDALLDRLGLSRVRALFPEHLSVGQRQRLAIARALSHKPDFVVADEPTAALDPQKSDEVLRLLLEAAYETGCGVILSSHEIDRIDRFSLPKARLNVRTYGRDVVSSLEMSA